ncbi:MAG: response regulator [Candidatus Buchananbacteria bacterium]
MAQGKKTILVVEDERPLQSAIKIKLEKNNFEVVTARSVSQALGLMEDINKIDVIWLDHYLLGKENGLDFVAKIKNDKNWKKIPVFVVSNTATDEKVKNYLSLGIEKYYIKSNYRLDNIVSDINNFLKYEK